MMLIFDHLLFVFALVLGIGVVMGSLRSIRAGATPARKSRRAAVGVFVVGLWTALVVQLYREMDLSAVGFAAATSAYIVLTVLFSAVYKALIRSAGQRWARSHRARYLLSMTPNAAPVFDPTDYLTTSEEALVVGDAPGVRYAFMVDRGYIDLPVPLKQTVFQALLESKGIREGVTRLEWHAFRPMEA